MVALMLLENSGNLAVMLTPDSTLALSGVAIRIILCVAQQGMLGDNLTRQSFLPSLFLPCVFVAQALDRAGGKVGNKGGEAAITAIEMANLMADLRADGLAAHAWGPAK